MRNILVRSEKRIAELLAGGVLLSWLFSGLGIPQFRVYIVFCNKDVI